MNKFALIQMTVGARWNSARVVLAWKEVLGSVLWAAIINTFAAINTLIEVCTFILVFQIRQLFNSDGGTAFHMIQVCCFGNIWCLLRNLY